MEDRTNEDKVQDWYFTFGVGTILKDKYAKVNGTYGEARAFAFENFGSNFCMQYDKEHFIDAKMPEKYDYTEIENNAITGIQYRVYNKLEEEFKHIVDHRAAEVLAQKLYIKVADKIMSENKWNSKCYPLTDYEFADVLGTLLTEAV